MPSPPRPASPALPARRSSHGRPSHSRPSHSRPSPSHPSHSRPSLARSSASSATRRPPITPLAALTLLPALFTALVGCEQAPADDPADAGPPPATCHAEGNWLVQYRATEDGARYREPDVLVIEGATARLDTYAELQRRYTDCDVAPTTEARWIEGTCELALTHRAGPCGGGTWRHTVTATVRFGDAPGGEAVAGEWPGDEAEASWGFELLLTRLADGAQCALPDETPAIPGPLYLRSEDPAAFAGPVEIVAVEPDGDVQSLRVRTAEGVELSVSVPSTVSLPAVGEMVWLDVEIHTPFWTESVFVLRHAEDGPLIVARMHGWHDWLAAGPWARAGITLQVAPACAAAWLPVECFTLTELQAVTVTAGGIDATVMTGGTVEIDPPGLGPARLAVGMARRDYAVDCTDYPRRWLALELVPVE
ncbi:MAG: hypothetical protein H6705_04050 [Myxococcales bacterium]|nr:hypothetical protein [Myxococcales bacterium]